MAKELDALVEALGERGLRKQVGVVRDRGGWVQAGGVLS